jgi:hypothetical protein
MDNTSWTGTESNNKLSKYRRRCNPFINIIAKYLRHKYSSAADIFFSQDG